MKKQIKKTKNGDKNDISHFLRMHSNILFTASDLLEKDEKINKKIQDLVKIIRDSATNLDKRANKIDASREN